MTDASVHTSDGDDLATSPSLLDRVRAGEAIAWNRFAELYEPLVHHWCRRARLSPESAADVWQEVLLAVSNYIGDFERRGPGSFRSWLRSIARSKICDEQRRRALPAEGGS